MAKKPKSQYWDIKPITAIPAQYYVVFGERSNGKTYGTLKHALERYFKTGEQFAYVRRWTDDVKKSKMSELFASIVNNKVISELSGGKWNGVRYVSNKFYCMATDMEGDTVVSEEPMGHVFAINAMEHTKSISFPKVTTIIFDEFISRQSYLPDEFSLFMNLLSTIIRDRDNVTIYMLGNTVSKDCPYFRDMGLRHVFQQTPGTIDTYTYKKDGNEMIIAVEYTKNIAAKKSDKYFIFDNPKLDMITGGAWELAIYPHLFEKYKLKQIMFTFFILYRDNILQCEVIEGEYSPFIYVHQKTTPLKDEDNDLIYSTQSSARWNWKVDITRPEYNIERTISRLISQERICFQDNEIGEVFNDYLKWCRQHSNIKR